MIIKEYYQFLFPCLFVILLLITVLSWTNISNLKKIWQKFMVIVISIIITMTPFFDLSLADYMLSINYNFSIGSMALIVVLLWPKLFAKPLLSEKFLWIFLLWNTLISLVLFSSYLCLVPYDLYPLGYNFSIFFLIMALLTFVTIWRWYPLAYIFIAYIAAFNLKLLPSPNLFDYITDGFLLLISLGLLVSLAASRRGKRVMLS